MMDPFDIGLPNVSEGCIFYMPCSQILNKSLIFLVIHKIYNFFPKQTLSFLLATRFVQMCEVSMP